LLAQDGGAAALLAFFLPAHIHLASSAGMSIYQDYKEEIAYNDLAHVHS